MDRNDYQDVNTQFSYFAVVMIYAVKMEHLSFIRARNWENEGITKRTILPGQSEVHTSADHGKAGERELCESSTCWRQGFSPPCQAYIGAARPAEDIDLPSHAKKHAVIPTDS